VGVKLYVGNLSYETQETDLQNLFAQAGSVLSATVIKDRYSGRSKGFAFVEMGAQSEAEKAISMFNGFQFAERELKVSMARPREERSGGDYFGGGSGGGYRDKKGSRGGHNQRGGPRRY
jgi:cold-inducible RNA-binding protein